MSQRNYPRISVILPTLNAEEMLENCLASLERQIYPRERLELIVADAHSQDASREIAKRHGAMVLDDDGENMEEGKRLALAHATGDYVVFLDADNELTDPSYFELAVSALSRHPQALGVEAYYLPSVKMSSFCAYLTRLLHISDPVSWLMSERPILVGKEEQVERWTLPGEQMAYPLGANGFMFRKVDLDRVHSTGNLFQDTHLTYRLMQAGKREWLRLEGRGVHHYYTQNIWSFLLKRRRAMAHYFNVSRQSPISWASRPSVPAWAAGLYCVSVVGPLYHTLLGLIRDRDWRWLWHLPATLASLIGIIWGYQTHRSGRNRSRLIAKLQPRQTLKK